MVDIIEAMLDRSEQERPVVVLVEPGPGHWERAGSSDDPTLVVLIDPSASDVVAAVRRGADGVIAAEHADERLAEAVATLRVGGSWLDPMHLREVVEAFRGSGTQDTRPELTGRERQILESILEGRSVKQTSLHLGVAPKTIENLQGRLFKKIGAVNRAHAVTRAFELRLLEDPTPVLEPDLDG